ncbi:hypothetical protein [Halobacillus litoralis]|uniref:hypothetical protein n=1 Tax=Halobacillus litoralis TaxID=45668 RepID=UPI001CFC8B9A|nr:hypothetical protein [Halobacillus litoralis]
MKHIKNLGILKYMIAVFSLILLAGCLGFLTIYNSHLKVRELTNECYDKGGMPSIEKSGIRIVDFSCDVSS